MKSIFTNLFFGIFLFSMPTTNAQIISTICGNGYAGYYGNAVAANTAQLLFPQCVALDASGTLYVVDGGNNLIRAISSGGIITTLAGKGVSGYSGDGGPATNALISPSAVCVDALGNIYIADYYNVIRKINPLGIISTIAGTSVPGYMGDGGAATLAQFNFPIAITNDATGNLYVVDNNNTCIRKISASGIVTTIAGNYVLGAGYNSDGIAATDAQLNGPAGVAVDASGNLYIADQFNYRIRKVNTSGVISTVLSDSMITGFNPTGVSVDATGNVYVTDAGNFVYKLTTAGLVTKITGNGTNGFAGDGEAATSAELNSPVSIAVSSTGAFFIADQNNNRIRMVNSIGTISTYAGGTLTGLGDGNAANSAELNFPTWVTKDAMGNTYIADAANNRIRKINNAGIITTFAGTGASGNTGDGGPATAATFNLPYCIAFDTIGNLYIADEGNNTIRMVNTAGIISTFAGNGTYGFGGDGGLASATTCSFKTPVNIALDKIGNMYICDKGNARIRKINTSGIISTIAGTGTAGFAGDGLSAVAALIHSPHGVQVDDTGNVYFSDTYNNRVRKINTLGIINTIAGNGTAAYAGNGGPAISAELNQPYGLSIDTMGNIYITDARNNCIRKIDATGVITTVAGTGIAGFAGDGGLATSAQLTNPYSTYIDKSGNLYIADFGNLRLRYIRYNVLVNNIANPNTHIDLYPNPNNGSFTFSITTNKQEQTHIFILNLLGQTVKDFYATTNVPTEIKLALPAGDYYINASTNSEHWVEKMVLLGGE